MVQFLSINFLYWISSIFVGFFKSSHFFVSPCIIFKLSSYRLICVSNERRVYNCTFEYFYDWPHIAACTQIEADYCWKVLHYVRYSVVSRNCSGSSNSVQLGACCHFDCQLQFSAAIQNIMWTRWTQVSLFNEVSLIKRLFNDANQCTVFIHFTY